MPDDGKKPAATVAVGQEPDKRNIHQRLHAVMQEVAYVQKDRKIGTYMVVTHDAVTAAVRPALVKHGVIYYPQNMVHAQDGNRTEVHLDLVFANVNDPADKIAVPTFGYGIDPQDKGPGKAVSYAVKMALLKTLGLETGEDADDGSEEEHKPAPKTAVTPAPTAERQLNKAQARPEYTKLVNELQAQQSLSDLAAWGKRNKPRLAAMPPDWQQDLLNIYEDHKHTLSQKAA